MQGAPFPQNLRPHRRDRPHRRRYPASRQHIVTEEDLAVRDPIILTKNPSFVLGDAGKSLMRMSPKTCPTHKTPVDEKELYEAWVKWRESLRWKWHFNKNLRPEDIDQDHKSQAWDEKTERSAPYAQDCQN